MQSGSHNRAGEEAIPVAELRRWLHDVRQPLQQLSSALDLLALTALEDQASPPTLSPLTEEQREVLRLAVDAAQRIEQKFRELDERVHAAGA